MRPLFGLQPSALQAPSSADLSQCSGLGSLEATAALEIRSVVVSWPNRWLGADSIWTHSKGVELSGLLRVCVYLRGRINQLLVSS